MSGETMNFPDIAEEFMEQYKIVDSEEVYTNGAELVPIFRMEQWFKQHPEPHWIPVTERLPEYGEAVLTIAQDDVYEVNHVIDDVHGEWFWENNGKVIAWMPLPEPYKGVTT